MGSDFLMAFLAAGRKKKLDLGAGRSALERLRITPLGEWPEDFLETQCGHVPEDHDEAESMKHSFVELLTADLNMVEESVDGAARRDLWSGTIGDKFVIMSGGMSGGEPPTEAFESLDRLAAAGIARAMGFDE